MASNNNDGSNLQNTKQHNRMAASRAHGTAGTAAGYNGAGGAGAYEFGGELTAGIEGAGNTGHAQAKQQNRQAMQNAATKAGGGMSKSK